MKLTSLLASGVLLMSAAVPNLMAADAFTAEQKTEMQKVIHDYLVNNPEVLLEVSQALQQQQQQTMQNQAQEAISENANQLFAKGMTSLGNPKGKVTLVEFFDYQCIHCKKMAPVIQKLIKDNADLHVILKEFPIFGGSSNTASKAALAASMQGKYLEMHDELLKQEERLNDDMINAAAKKIGLNMDKFKTDMESKQVTDDLEANRVLAEKLHLMGTPAFIIASTPDGQFKANSKPDFIPGAASEQTLQEMIKKASS